MGRRTEWEYGKVRFFQIYPASQQMMPFIGCPTKLFELMDRLLLRKTYSKQTTQMHIMISAEQAYRANHGFEPTMHEEHRCFLRFLIQNFFSLALNCSQN